MAELDRTFTEELFTEVLGVNAMYYCILSTSL